MLLLLMLFIVVFITADEVASDRLKNIPTGQVVLTHDPGESHEKPGTQV
jgi:hypothetical protein